MEFFFNLLTSFLGFDLNFPAQVLDGLDVLKEDQRYDLIAIDCFDGAGASYAFLDQAERLSEITKHLTMNFVIRPQDEGIVS